MANAMIRWEEKKNGAYLHFYEKSGTHTGMESKKNVNKNGAKTGSEPNDFTKTQHQSLAIVIYGL